MQRKGQFIYNMLRPVDEKIKSEIDLLEYKALIADRLWNMKDEDFDKMQKQYRQFHGLDKLEQPKTEQVK